MRFSELVATMPDAEHCRLVLAVTTGMHEAWRGAEVIQQDGDVEALRERVSTTLVWLEEARSLLGDESAGDLDAPG